MSVHKSSDNHSATKELKEIKKLLENKREDNMNLCTIFQKELPCQIVK